MSALDGGIAAVLGEPATGVDVRTEVEIARPRAEVAALKA
jgi:hypothetical protein